MKKILLTGGGTGGHIYPLISVGKKLKKIGRGDVEIEYIGPKSKWLKEIKKEDIKTHTVASAKIRRYFDLRNLIDIPKFIFSIFQALLKLYFLMPDAVFSKGGPGSTPVVWAAKFYMIPILIHESDAAPSLTTKLTAKPAKRIGLSFNQTAKQFPESKTFVSGNPVRNEFIENIRMNKAQAKSYLGFNQGEPLILVMGGSQGSDRINSLVLDNLENLTSDFQILHITGSGNIEDVRNLSSSISQNWNEDKKSKYKAKGFLSAKDMAIAMNGSDIMIARAGSGTIFESAVMGLPAILVPLKEAANGHQKENAHEYSQSGAAIVIEEDNFTLNIVSGQTKEILQNPQRIKRMTEAAKNFAKPKASNIIAKEIFNL